MINFTCAQCGKHFQVGDECAGRMGKCKACGTLIFIPSPEIARPAVASTPVAYANSSPGTPVAYASGSPGYASGSQHAPVAYAPGLPGTPGAYASGSPGLASGSTGPTPMRIRRLQADALQMQNFFAKSPLIRVRPAEGSLPERYMIEYRVRGLVRGENGMPVYKDHHFAEIQLTSEYPRQSPKCRMLTPIFHPNIEPATICVGDHWTAGERLVDLVIRIAEMIAYQAYNIKSPLDGEAAMWADQHRQHLPTDHRDMHPAE